MIKDSSFNDLSYNEPGRIWVSGPAMMNGYYNNDEIVTQCCEVKDYGKHNSGETFCNDFKTIPGCLEIID